MWPVVYRPDSKESNLSLGLVSFSELTYLHKLVQSFVCMFEFIVATCFGKEMSNPGNHTKKPTIVGSSSLK